MVGSRLGHEHGSCRIITSNLSQKSVKDALDLEGFRRVFNYKMRFKRAFFDCVKKKHLKFIWVFVPLYIGLPRPQDNGQEWFRRDVATVWHVDDRKKDLGI